MIQIYGNQSLPRSLHQIEIGGLCPHCRKNSRFTRRASVMGEKLKNDGGKEIVLSYSCDACLRAIPVYWEISGWNHKSPKGQSAKMIIPVKENFDFEHVPDAIKNEINEALDCLSVNAFNGFASLCRRTTQAICDNLGASGSSKVKKQIQEMFELSNLDEKWQEITMQILLTGHDGAHPHLPTVNRERVMILLSFLQDLTYQLYTRPGKVKEAAQLRKKAIKDKKKA